MVMIELENGFDVPQMGGVRQFAGRSVPWVSHGCCIFFGERLWAWAEKGCCKEFHIFWVFSDAANSIGPEIPAIGQVEADLEPLFH